jgi:hypothetical protein
MAETVGLEPRFRSRRTVRLGYPKAKTIAVCEGATNREKDVYER